MKKGIVVIGIGFFVSLCPLANAQSGTNSYKSPSSISWDVGTAWSLNSSPSITDTADFITNTTTKTVTIDAAVDPSLLTISNLTLGGTATTTNTLFLKNVGTVNALHVLNAMTVTNNGILQITNSVLQVDGISGGKFQMAGSLQLFGKGKVVLSNAVFTSSANLQFALGTNAIPVVVTNGLTIAGTLNITNDSGFTTNTYTLFNYGGTLVNNGLIVGTMPLGYTGTVNTTASQVQLVVGYVPVIADFTSTPTIGVEPLVVTNTDISTGLVTNRLWTFGDGATISTAVNPVTHTYTAGTYTVTLNACGPAGCSSNSKPNLIVVSNAAPVAVFSGSPVSGAAPLAVTFTDSSTGVITNRFWDFGDLSTTNTLTNSVAHSYAAGTYTVQLTVYGPGGSNTNTKANYIGVTNSPPVALFSASPTNGSAPLAVTFTDTSTGTITNRFWDFGDSGTTNVTTTSVIHSYGPGTYNVTLTVTGPAGTSSNTRSNLITVTGSLSAFEQWQQQYFTCTLCPQAAAGADPDGDGMSNTNEFLAGTVPTNGASAFRIISVVQAGADFVITWKTAGVRTNALQAITAGSYDSNGFQDISTIIVPVNGDTTTNYTDFGGATNTPARFYRVRLVTEQVSPVDTDGDGIPDAWTQQYFGHPTGQAGDHSLFNDDADGDGLSNLSEYLSGTNPTNSASALRITSILQANNDIVVNWSTAGGRTNMLQVSSGDAGSYSNNFGDVQPAGMIITGVGDTTTNYTYLGGATNTPAQFYRVRLVP